MPLTHHTRTSARKEREEKEEKKGGGGKKKEKQKEEKKISPFGQNLVGSIRPSPEPIQFFVLSAMSWIICGLMTCVQSK